MNLLNTCELKMLVEPFDNTYQPFQCTEQSIADFLNTGQAYAFYLERACYTYIYSLKTDPSQVVAYYTLTNTSVNLKNTPLVAEKYFAQYPYIASVSAVLIGRLGVATAYQGKKIGKQILDAIKAIYLYGEQKSAARVLCVDAINTKQVVGFYERNNFRFIKEPIKKNNEIIDFYEGDTSAAQTRKMLFDLYM